MAEPGAAFTVGARWRPRCPPLARASLGTTLVIAEPGPPHVPPRHMALPPRLRRPQTPIATAAGKLLVVSPPLKGPQGAPAPTGPRVPILRPSPPLQTAPRVLPHTPVAPRIGILIRAGTPIATHGPVPLVRALPTAGRNGPSRAAPRGVPGTAQPHTVDATEEEIPVLLTAPAAATKPLPPPLQGVRQTRAPLLISGRATQIPQPLIQPRALLVALLVQVVITGPLPPVPAPLPPFGARVAVAPLVPLGLPAVQGAVAGGRVKAEEPTGPPRVAVPDAGPAGGEVVLVAAPAQTAATGPPTGNGRPALPPPQPNGAPRTTTRDGRPGGHPNTDTSLTAFGENYSTGSGGCTATTT